VKLACRVACRDFLPVSGKIVLPFAVPFGFVLPPIVTVPLPRMRPVPNFDVAALRDKFCTASRA
jgi:hypothetical protein